MFRRRTSSPGNIHYRININKNMCPTPVDIYIDGDSCQVSFAIHCDIADTVLYGNRITEFITITEITDHEEIIYFTYRNKMYNQITNKDHITWEGNFIANRYCIATNVCEGCEFFAIGTSSYNNNYKVRIIIVAP